MAESSSARPHWWTILMAVAAILISLVSLYYTHRTLQVNERTSRAVIQASNAQLLSSWGWDNGVEPVQIEITLANLGKSLARNISVDLLFRTCYETMVAHRGGASRADCVIFGTEKLSLDDLGPGAIRTYEKKVLTTEEMFLHGRDAVCAPAPWRKSDLACPSKVKIIELSAIPTFRYADSIGTYEYTACFVNRADILGVVKAGTVYPCLTHQKPQEFTPLTESWE